MKNRTILTILLILCEAFPTPAATRLAPQQYVTIQAAIDDSNDGDTVIVAPGTYTGPGNRDIDFKGKAITLRSEDGPENCIIDCNGTENDQHRGFYFHTGEDANSLLDGFTITNGLRYRGGAVFCADSSPRIINCALSTNTAKYNGGGIYCSGGNPTITNCTLSANAAERAGGGIYCYGATPTITNCILSSNTAGDFGGGIYCDGGIATITNCILSANTAEDAGGGIHFYRCSNSNVSNCTITANTASHGGGLCCRDDCTLVLTGSIIRANQAPVGPQVALGDPPPIPVGPRGGSPAPDTASIAYCDLQGGEPGIYMRPDTSFAWGPGNIDLDPAFVDPNAEDYHLSFHSPCVNTGDPDFAPAAGESDVYGNARVINGRIDIGAAELDYEGPLLGVFPRQFKFRTRVEDGNPPPKTLSVGNIGTGELEWSIASDCSWLNVNPASGQSTDQFDDVAIDVDISAIDPGMYTCELAVAGDQAPDGPLKVLVTLYVNTTLHVPAQHATIQTAIDAATDADYIIVADGIYTGSGNRGIDFKGKTIALRSENGPEFATIDCGYRGRGFYFHSGEDANSVIDGFTITNGFAEFGAGIYCQQSSPTITNCTITNNMAIGADQQYIPPPRIDCGGGIYCEQAAPTITDCLIASNWSCQFGGGIYCSAGSAPKLVNCIIAGNSAVEGGGIYFRDCSQTSPTITDSAFIANAAGAMGSSPVGGLGGGMCNYNSSPILTRCEFRYNWAATEGAGIFNSSGSLILTNCILSGNSAERYGGGLSVIAPGPAALVNCTLIGNSAPGSGCIYNAGGPLVITNSILWNNTPRQLHDNYSPYTVVTYSNVEGGFSGLGNIDADPCFVDPGCWVHADDLTVLVEPNNPDALWLDGDYHLMSAGWRWHQDRRAWTWDDVTSPCIDAGNPASPLSDEPLSIPQDPNSDWGQNLRINMGAYGGTAEASIAPDKWALLADYNNDGIVNFTDYLCLFWKGLEPEDRPRGDLDNSGKVGSQDLALLADDWLAPTTWFDAPQPGSPLPQYPPYPPVPPPKPRACFPADTLVRANGALVPISEVVPGQKVNTYCSMSIPAYSTEVEQVREHEGTYDCYDVVLATGGIITVADEHYFLVDAGCEQWLSVHDLKPGSVLKSLSGPVRVTAVVKRPVPITGKVYNLKIKDSDRYFVGRDAITVRDY